MKSMNTIQFKGHTFKRAKEIVTMPEMKNDCYVRFGKITTKDKGTVTKWQRINAQGIAVPIYATPIDDDGYSLTNMMYGKLFKYKGTMKRHIYLSLNGRVYVTTIPAKEKMQMRPYIPKEMVPEIL